MSGLSNHNTSTYRLGDHGQFELTYLKALTGGTQAAAGLNIELGSVSTGNSEARVNNVQL